MRPTIPLLLVLAAVQVTAGRVSADCGPGNEACLIGAQGDLDLDGDVDLADLADLIDCLGGPGIPAAPACVRGDIDRDDDVDLGDFAAAQAAATGACACPPNLTAPAARFEASTFLGTAPLTVSLDASRTTDAEAVVDVYYWAFGDGGSASGVTAAHTYTVPGSYTIRLIAADAGGLVADTTLEVTVSDGTYELTDAVSENEARRFLWQAAFGPRPADVAFIVQNGYEPWIDDQMVLPPTELYYQYLLDHDAAGFGGYNLGYIWDDICIEGADQLRQRVAWALLQIVVMNSRQNELGDRANAYYYSEYIKRAFGNYRDLLEFVTYSHHMGRFLTYLGNRKADLITGALPDENYARELMQLFTIGLWELNLDGTRRRGPDNEYLPTYGNADIQQFARIFTGLDWNNTVPWENAPLTPMRIRTPDHEFGAKQLLDYPGAVPGNGYIPAITQPSGQVTSVVQHDIRAALDNVFHHPNCAPFVCRQLIQRLVTSNPSPAYVARVADAFEGRGPYAAGTRGSLAAVVKAILLDHEARDPAYRSNPMYGLVKEPLIVRWALYRILERVDRPAEPFPLRIAADPWNTFNDFGQAFMASPSVFNFYPPDYSPPNTTLSDFGLVAPELRIFNDYTALAIADRLHGDLVARDGAAEAGRYDDWRALAGDPTALVAALDAELMHGTLSAEAEQIIIAALDQINGDTDRVRTAVWLMVLSPEFRVLR